MSKIATRIHVIMIAVLTSWFAKPLVRMPCDLLAATFAPFENFSVAHTFQSTASFASLHVISSINEIAASVSTQALAPQLSCFPL